MLLLQWMRMFSCSWIQKTNTYDFPYNPPLNAAFPQNCHNSAFDIALLVILCISTVFLIWNLSVLFTDLYEEVPFLFGQSSENTFFQCYLGKREKPKI